MKRDMLFPKPILRAYVPVVSAGRASDRASQRPLFRLAVALKQTAPGEPRLPWSARRRLLFEKAA